MPDTEVFIPSVCKTCTTEDCNNCDVEVTSDVFMECWEFLAKEAEK